MNSVEKCQHYGRFLSQLDRPAAEGLYWILFSLVIILLFACSWNYGRMMEKIEGLGTENRRRQRLLHKSFWAAIIGGLIACGCGFLAAFTLLTLQFCDEEPLASLYWSTWTVLVVGGIVAIFGISLHIRHLIKSRRPPPWALALGTPVLVVAGLGHYFQGKISSKARRLVSRSREAKRTKKVDGDTDLEGEPTVREGSIDSTSHSTSSPTADGEPPYTNLSNDYNAKILGVTEDGDILIRIAPAFQQQLNARFSPMSCLTLNAGLDSSTSETFSTGPWNMPRSSSGMSFYKGKEKVVTVSHAEDMDEDRDTVVNDSDFEGRSPLPK